MTKENGNTQPQPFVTEAEAEKMAIEAVTGFVNSCNCKSKKHVLAVLDKIIIMSIGIHEAIEKDMAKVVSIRNAVGSGDSKDIKIH